MGRKLGYLMGEREDGGCECDAYIWADVWLLVAF